MSNLTVDLQADDGESRSRRQRQRTAGLVFIVALIVLLGKAPPAEVVEPPGTGAIDTAVPPPPATTTPLPEARLVITPPTIGDTVIGQPSGPAALTLTNSGDATMRIDSIVTSNPAFGIGRDECSLRNLDPGGQCVVDVVFHPTQRGPVSGRWTITDDRQQQHFVDLNGNGLLRRLVIAPQSVAFGSTLVDTVPVRRVRIANDGDVAIQFESVAIDPAESLFSIAPAMNDGVATVSDPCQPGAIEPGQSCEAAVRFFARAVGEFQARVVVRGAGGVEEASAPVSASAVRPPIGELRADPSRVVMTTRLAGLVVTNSGNGPAQITNSRLTFDDENPWLRIAKSECTGTVLPGRSCSITVLMMRRPSRPARLILDVDGATSPTLEIVFAPPLQLPPGVTTLTTTANPD